MLTEEEGEKIAERLIGEHSKNFKSVFEIAYELAFKAANIATAEIDSVLENIDNGNLIQVVALKELIFMLNCTNFSVMAKRGIPPEVIFRLLRDDIERVEQRSTQILNDTNEAKNDK